MVKNMFSIIGIFAILVLGIGTVSAAVDNFELSIVGDGNSINRLTGINNSAQTFAINVNNTNTTLGNVYVNWSVAPTTTMTLPVGQVINLNTNRTITGFVLTMPYASSSYKQLTANIYSEDTSTFFGKEIINIYYNNTDYSVPTHISGCTDSGASNYNSFATIDDGSCVYPLESWCNEDFDGEKGDLKITNVDVTNNGQGDDDKWEYLDEIEIEVTVENTHKDESINDVVIEIEIRDDNNNTYTRKDFGLNDIKDRVGRVKKDGGEKTTTFKIKELPIDLEEGDYYLYVRAYEDNNEDKQCVSISDDLKNSDRDERYFDFRVEASEDSTVIVKKDLENIMASCGDENVEVTFMVYNTGTDDEKRVLVNLYNAALKVDEYKVIDNLKDGKGKDVTFFISIPKDLQKNSYVFDIYTYYGYEDGEEELDEFSYDSNSDDDGSDFTVGLEIISCNETEPSINANLESAAEVGTDLVIKALVTNNGKDNNFIFSASNFESWADLVSITPQTESINNGEFTEVTIILKPKIAGTQSFKINTIVNGESHSQSVSVNIAKRSGLLGMNNVLTYTIIGSIAVLILIFLVLIARVSRKSSKPQF